MPSKEDRPIVVHPWVGYGHRSGASTPTSWATWGCCSASPPARGPFWGSVETPVRIQGPGFARIWTEALQNRPQTCPTLENDAQTCRLVPLAAAREYCFNFPCWFFKKIVFITAGHFVFSRGAKTNGHPEIQGSGLYLKCCGFTGGAAEP